MPSSRLFRISGTGCALVDYLYKPVCFTDMHFKKYLSENPGDGGLSPGKLVFKDEFEKYSKETYLLVRNAICGGKDPVALNIGGPSIVSLIHAAQLLNGSDTEVYFYGSKGADGAGAFMDEKLKMTPLKIGLYKTGTQYTPFTDVLSDPDFEDGQGERIFINNIGAAWEFLPEDLDDFFFQSDMVVFGGTALVPYIHQDLGKLLSNAKANNAITVVNTVYDFLSEKLSPQKPWMLGRSIESYKFIDLLITNMEEAIRLSGTSSIDEAIMFFKSTGVGAAIITHGSNPLFFFASNSLFGNIPQTSMPVSEKVVRELMQDKHRSGDTTGCGDNFAGGVIASIAMQLTENPGAQVDLKLALALGVASGGYTCFYNGGTFYENFPGQKKSLIDTLYHDYLNQIGMSENS